MPQENLIVTGTASENFLETAVKHFMLLSKTKWLGWHPVLLGTDWSGLHLECLRIAENCCMFY